MIRDSLLAAGVLFATFTQLRPSGVPVGFGEVCLVAWLGLTFARSIGSIAAPSPPAFLRLSVFWLLVAAALCIGTVMAVLVGERNVRAYFIHDLMAYALVAGISLLAVFQPDAATRLRRVAWLVVLFGSACLAIQLAQGYGLLAVAGLEVWFYDRLIGWTTNANQVGLLCLILVLLSLHLAETASRRSAMLAALGCGVLPVWAGYLSRSDAFLLALVVSVCCGAGLKCWKILAARRRRPGLGAVLAMLAVLALPVVLAASSPLAYVLAAGELAQHAHGEANERLERDIDSRTALWEQAFQRGLESRLLGLGPGPHLVRPSSLREPRWDAQPDFEAHNTLVDMFLQGGVLAVSSLLWLGFTAARGALRANLAFLPMLLVGLSGFALTHFVIRHPIVWFVMALTMAAGICTQRSTTVDAVFAARSRVRPRQ